MEDSVLTFTVTYQSILFFGLLTACALTTWHIAVRVGARRAVTYLAEEGIINLEEES